MDKEIKKPSLLVFLLLLMAPLAGVGIDLFVPSLPSIVNAFSSTENTVKFMIVSYLLGYAIGQPVFGSLSDIYGRKKPLIWGLLLYTLISLLIPVYKTIGMVLFLRVLQGIFVAAPGVLSKAILTDVFLGEKLAKLSTSMTIVWAIGPIVAPVIGGYLQEYLGWESSFYALFLYGLVLLVLVFLSLEETNQYRIPFEKKRLIQVYKEACLHKIFFGSIICISIAYSLIVIFNTAGPFLIQTVLGYSPSQYGHFALFMGLGFFIGSLLNRFLLRKIPSSKILPIAIAYGGFVSIFMLIISFLFGLHVWTLIGFTFFLLIASGMIFPNSMAKCLSLFPKTAGTATAIMGASFIIGTSLITSLASLLETSTLVPISACYVLLMIICSFVYFTMLKEKSNIQN